MNRKKEVLRMPFAILKDTLSKIKFNVYVIDHELQLNSEARSLLNTFYQRFYFFKFIKENKNPLFKKMQFKRDYKIHANNYPPLINPQITDTKTFTMAVPGGELSENLLIGYFKDIKNDNQNYFRNFFDKPIEPIYYYMNIIQKEIKKLIETMEGESDKKKILSLHYKDVSLLIEFQKFIVKIFNYAKKNNFPQLRSGHLIAIISGMEKYFLSLEKIITEMGFAAVSIENPEPIFVDIEELVTRLSDCLLAFTLDMLLPLSIAEGLRLEYRNGKIIIEKNEAIQKNYFSSIFDFFGKVFKGKRAKEKRKVNIGDKEKAAAGKTTLTKESKGAGKPVKKSAPLIESRFFIDIYTLLEKFIKELRSDLEPERDDNGEVTDYRQMFDVFDKPDGTRDLNCSKFILKGKFIGVDPMDYRYKDQTIVSSTHWIYDRIKTILTYYDFSAEKSLLENAKRFTTDVRALFIVHKRDMDETRKYGNFIQFKINLKRLFSSNKYRSKYEGYMNAIASHLDRARDEIERKEMKNAKDSR